MSILKRARFAVADRKAFDNLTANLNEQVSTLQSICSELAASAIDKSMTNRLLAGRRPVTRDLEFLIQSLREIASQAPRGSSQRQRMNLIVTTAELKKRLQDLDTDRDRILNKSDFNYEKAIWQFNNGAATFAVHQSTGQIKCCYIEWKSFENSTDVPNIPTEDDLKELAKLLCIKEFSLALNTLPCLGAFKENDSGRYGLVYKPPEYIELVPALTTWSCSAKGPSRSELRKPSTLLDELSRMPAEQPHIPDLGTRFAITRALVQSVYVLHVAGWVHKNIRPSSILFLPRESIKYPGNPSGSLAKNLNKPYLSGFGFSRATRDKTPYYASRYGDDDAFALLRGIRLDNYQHPRKRNDPKESYVESFDIYSLGCVLLEIGLWQPLDTVVPATPFAPEEFRDRVREIARNELPGQAGRIFAKAVDACLSVSGGESTEEAAELLCWKVAARLDECCA